MNDHDSITLSSNLGSHVYNITADLDPDKFYLNHPGKELYTSDKTTPENNVFIFGVRISVGNQSLVKEVYQFKTKSKGTTI
jgi:hypothetical protein